MKKIISLLATGVLMASVATVVIVSAQSDNATKQKTTRTEVPAVLNFRMKNLSGQEVDLSKYEGKVIMMVNTASKCGYTRQYKGLQELHDKYSAQGLTVLGFPSNDFGGQEPGSDEEIGTFCQKNYGVKFDMFSKVPVKGESKAALFEYLTSEETNPQHAGEIKWNFEKFLINRNGEIVGRFRSNVAPDSPEMIAAIEAELAKQ